MDSSHAAAAPQEGPGAGPSVTLNVVSPGIEGHKLVLPHTLIHTTVAQLKLRIQDQAPSKPGPDQQRLIYQGRALLLPEATLASIFGNEAIRTHDTFTVHMALRPTASTSPAPRSGTASAPSRPSVPEHVPNDISSGVRNGYPRPGSDTGPSAAPPPLSNPVGHASILGTQAAGPAGPGAGLQAVPLPPPPPPPPPIAGQLPNIIPFQTFLASAGHVPGHQVYHGQPDLQRVFHLENQINNLMASHHRLRAQHDELLARHNNSGQAAAPADNATQQTSQSPEAIGEHNTQGSGVHPANAPGNTGYVREGRGPDGAWRISVEQTTVHTSSPRPPMPAAFAPPSAAPTVAPANNLAAGAGYHGPLPFSFPPRGLPTIRAPFAPSLPFGLPSRNAAHTDPSAFPQQLYLVSNPSGYQALLIPPQGAVSVSPNFQLPNGLTATRTSSSQPAVAAGGDQDYRAPPAAQGAEGIPAQAPGEPAQQQGDGAADIVRILFPLGGHLWLLVRLLGFVYLLTGGATWTRTLLMCGLAVLVFVAQAGWLAPVADALGAPIRRRVERVVRINGGAGAARAEDQARRRGAHRQNRHGPDDQAARAGRDGQQEREEHARRYNARAPSPNREHNAPLERWEPNRAGAAGQAGATAGAAGEPAGRTAAAPSPLAGLAVTPEQLAARLLRERNERGQSVVQATLRRIERGVALFVTSLVPGWGEEHVRAQREQDAQRERQVAEDEVLRRRVEREREEAAAAADRKAESPAGETSTANEPGAVDEGESSRAATAVRQ